MIGYLILLLHVLVSPFKTQAMSVSLPPEVLPFMSLASPNRSLMIA